VTQSLLKTISFEVTACFPSSLSHSGLVPRRKKNRVRQTHSKIRTRYVSLFNIFLSYMMLLDADMDDTGWCRSMKCGNSLPNIQPWKTQVLGSLIGAQLRVKPSSINITRISFTAEDAEKRFFSRRFTQIIADWDLAFHHRGAKVAENRIAVSRLGKESSLSVLCGEYPKEFLCPTVRPFGRRLRRFRRKPHEQILKDRFKFNHIHWVRFWHGACSTGFSSESTDWWDGNEVPRGLSASKLVTRNQKSGGKKRCKRQLV